MKILVTTDQPIECPFCVLNAVKDVDSIITMAMDFFSDFDGYDGDGDDLTLFTFENQLKDISIEHLEDTLFTDWKERLKDEEFMHKYFFRIS